MYFGGGVFYYKFKVFYNMECNDRVVAKYLSRWTSGHSINGLKHQPNTKSRGKI
jgi:hypothetical protein